MNISGKEFVNSDADIIISGLSFTSPFSTGELPSSTSNLTFCSPAEERDSFKALNESLSSAGEQKVRLEVLDGNSPVENGEVKDSPEIIISASELTNSLPEIFKAGDGLDVFV